MTQQHTPSPWSINGYNLAQVIKIKAGADRNGREYRDGRHQEVIANVGEDGMPWDERAANTRLIATAPEMYDELVRAEKILRINDFTDHADRISALITKAGEY